MLAKTNNPYIPEFYQYAREKTGAGWDVPWFAVELIEGRSLSAERNSNGPLGDQRLLELAHDLLSALESIHTAGLIHLDLKPDNVMLEPGRARLIDFGLAAQAYRVQKGISGTPGFLAPEQLDDVLEEKDFAPAVDMFKLGMTLAWAAGIDAPELWACDPYGAPGSVRRSMQEGPRLGTWLGVVRDLVSAMLAFDAQERPTASQALEIVRSSFPSGSPRSTFDAGQRKRSPIEPPLPDAAPSVRPASNELKPKHLDANVGAKVKVVDRLGLDWLGVVVGLDPNRAGNVLVKHQSIGSRENVRSYPLTQVEPPWVCWRLHTWETRMESWTNTTSVAGGIRRKKKLQRFGW